MGARERNRVRPRDETIEVPGTIQGVARAGRTLDAFCRALGLADPDRARLQVVLDEVLSNIVRYGFGRPGGRPGTIAVALSGSPRGVTLEVIDDAPPFDPQKTRTPDTTSPIEERTPGGLGIALIESLMHEVRYERRGERNHLTLSWRPDPKDARPIEDANAKRDGKASDEN